MKQFLGTACLTIVAMIGLAQTTEANGGLFRRSSGCCATPCAAPCTTTVQAPAPAPVQYEERKVKVYTNVWKDKEINVSVCKLVTSQVPYTYFVSVPVWSDVKRMVTVSTPVSKQVDFTYTVLVPKTVQKEVNVTTYNCVTENIVQKVPVCRVVCVSCVDACGRCYTQRQVVTEMQDVTRCVVKRIPVVTKQMVNVTVCDRVEQKGTKMVCEIVRTQTEQMCKVCTYTQEKREGVRTVCTPVTETVKRIVKVCERVESEQVVRVAICPPPAPCAAPCATPCNTGCGSQQRSGLFGGGLFRRGGGCCN